MQQSRTIIHWTNQRGRQHSPRRLRSLGKHEEFLEEIISEHPGLLGLESRRSGIYGPFVCFRQVSLKTPAGRDVYPDIVFLAASGHFIVVEVKLCDNPELKNRDVIAQIIDYASSFAVLNDQQLVELFDKSADTPSWFEFISSRFPEEDDHDELAHLMRDRIIAGEINLVIACDQVPPGITEIVRGIAVQQSTSFALDLIEIAPFRADGDEEIIFVPSNRLSTEIVARTTVTVAYQGPPPDVSVETTPIEEISTIIKAKPPTARVWPPEEVEKVVREANDPTEVQLLNFCKQYSAGGEFVSPQVKSNAAFGFFAVGRKADGKKAKNMLFWFTHGWGTLYLNLAVVRQLVDAATSVEFEQRLKACFKNQIDTSAPNPGVKVAVLTPAIADFEQAILWIQEQIVVRAGLFS